MHKIVARKALKVKRIQVIKSCAASYLRWNDQSWK